MVAKYTSITRGSVLNNNKRPIGPVALFVRLNHLPWHSVKFYADFQNCHIGHDAWSLTKDPEVTSTPGASKLGLFSLYGQRFPRYGPIFKIAIILFGHKTWSLTKIQKLHIYSLSTPGGSKLRLFLLYGQRFPRYGPISKIPIFAHETCSLAKVSEANTVEPGN